MERRSLFREGPDVCAVGFGAIKLPEVDFETGSRALNRALDLGINFVDTARNYGESEAKIGRALESRRSEYVLATKTAARDAAGLRNDLETSLRELRTDVIDLYQLHSVSDRETWRKVSASGGALEEAVNARERGKIRHIGISSHRALDVMQEAIESGQFSTIMAAYSPVDQENVGDGILPLAHSRGMGVIAMKPLCGGRLSSYPDDAGVKPRPPDPVVCGSLRCILSNPAVSVVIPGMRAEWQVEQNVRAAQGFVPMTAEEKHALIKDIGRLRKGFRYGQICLRCGYCQPCPQGIVIPDVLRAANMLRNYPESLKPTAKEIFQRLEVKPEACRECGQCVEKCPAGLNVPLLLKEAAAAFAARCCKEPEVANRQAA
jgi:predicted aldo/keto reductase-like oxidoreductase